MIKACIKLLITGIILLIVGMIGVSVLWVNGYEDVFSLPVRYHSSDTIIEVVDNGYSYDGEAFSVLDMKYADTVNKLDVKVNAGNFTVLTGDTLSISGSNINIEYLDYKIENGCLYVTYSPEFYLFNWDFDFDETYIVITVPPKFYETANFYVKAGGLSVADIEIGKLYVDFTAGSSSFSNVYVSEAAQIKMTAGDCVFAECIFNNANIKMTAGSMYYTTCKIFGENVINMTAGDLYMELLGKRQDYKFSVHRTAGGVYIDGDYWDNNVVETTMTYAFSSPEEVSDDTEVSQTESVAEKDKNSFDINITAGECNILFDENE
ncbi:MAG: DUF4097 domain-containing protein [Oscillospiraceae bacterium]|nr:DUF4097 domain-containing protein [Oscillospiraceae bacterium]